MHYELTEFLEQTIHGQLQKKYHAIAYEDNTKAVVVTKQDLWLSGDALNDPQAAFVDGLTSTPDAFIAANLYAAKRSNEYPSIAKQLDDIYHNGIDGWKATIKVTKDKYPKP